MRNREIESDTTMSCDDSIDITDLLKRLDDVEKAVAMAEEVKKEENILTDENETDETIEKTEEIEETEEIIEEVAEEETVEKTEETLQTDEPKREDYDCPVEFNKAYTAWLDKQTAEAPITKGEIAKLLKDFKEDILKAIPGIKFEGDMTLGEAIKKSALVPRGTEGFEYDFDLIAKSATGVDANMVPMREAN